MITTGLRFHKAGSTNYYWSTNRRDTEIISFRILLIGSDISMLAASRIKYFRKNRLLVAFRDRPNALGKEINDETRSLEDR
jgi:hypothetical protein